MEYSITSFFRRFSSDFIKILACVTMLIDHAAVVFNVYSVYPLLYTSMRTIGRLSFPLFCFLIVQGFRYTKNVKMYALRLLALAVLSEVIFDYVFYHAFFSWRGQNVVFTLFIGLLVLIGVRYFNNRTLAVIGFAFLGCTVAYLLNSDYRAMGVLMILFFYYKQYDRLGSIVGIIILNVINWNIQAFATFSLIFTEMYKEKERRLPKYFFYLFYPVHLIVLLLLKELFVIL